MDDPTLDDARRDGDGPGLPPPAFASDRGGSGKTEEVAVREEDAGGQVPDEAFIDPDEPIVRSGTRISDDAFFDPDDPIVRKAPPRKPKDFEEVVGSGPGEDEGDEAEDEEVVVTGIGNDPHLDDPEIAALEKYGDPHVVRLVEMVGTLADNLRDRGEAGLKTTSGMTRFEATLRAYCVGYLAAQRESDDEA